MCVACELKCNTRLSHWGCSVGLHLGIGVGGVERTLVLVEMKDWNPETQRRRKKNKLQNRNMCHTKIWKG